VLHHLALPQGLQDQAVQTALPVSQEIVVLVQHPEPQDLQDLQVLMVLLVKVVLVKQVELQVHPVQTDQQV
jgi:hypothetical protein